MKDKPAKKIILFILISLAIGALASCIINGPRLKKMDSTWGPPTTREGIKSEMSLEKEQRREDADRLKEIEERSIEYDREKYADYTYTGEYLKYDKLIEEGFGKRTEKSLIDTHEARTLKAVEDGDKLTLYSSYITRSYSFFDNHFTLDTEDIVPMKLTFKKTGDSYELIDELSLDTNNFKESLLKVTDGNKDLGAYLVSIDTFETYNRQLEKIIEVVQGSQIKYSVGLYDVPGYEKDNTILLEEEGWPEGTVLLVKKDEYNEGKTANDGRFVTAILYHKGTGIAMETPYQVQGN